MKTLLHTLLLFAICLTAYANTDGAPKAKIIGSVNAPGTYDITPNENVLLMLQKAKGGTVLWNRRIRITRVINGAKESTLYDVRKRKDKASSEQEDLEQIKVHAGDVVWFLETVD
jgi:protein involved in polysaccharide export with SLBB domain